MRTVAYCLMTSAGVILGATACLLHSGWPDGTAELAPVVDASGDVPLLIVPKRLKLLSIPDEEWHPIVERFVPTLRVRGQQLTDLSICIHCLKLHGKNARFAPVGRDDAPARATGADLLAVLTDLERGRSVFGKAVLSETRYGVRFRPQA